MPKMTSTLTEMEEIIWRCLHNKVSITLVRAKMKLEYSDFTEDAIENLVNSIYLKDFNTN